MSILAGGLHLVIMQVLVVISAAIYHAAGAHSPGRRSPWTRALLIVAVCLAFAIGGGAIQLLPSVEYSSHAIRFIGSGAVPASQRIPYAYLGDNLLPQTLVGLVVPAFSGPPSAGEYVSPYLGVFPLFLVVIAIARCWQRPWVRYFAGLALVTFLYSLGNFSLMHGLLYALVPFLSMAREADRFMYLADFALSVLAAYGVDVLVSRQPEVSWDSLELAFRWAAGASALALVYPPILGRGDVSSWISLSLLLVLLSYALFRYAIRTPDARWMKFLILSLIVFDLAAFDWSAANRLHEAARGTDQMERLRQARGVANFLRSRPGLFRVDVQTELAPNIGDAYGIESTLGNAVTMQTDYDRMRGHPDLLNVRYLVRPASAKDPGPVYQDSQWKVYENPGGYPRAWLVHETLVVPDSEKVFALLDNPPVDLHRVAVVSAPVPLSSGPPDGSREAATLRRLNNNRLRVDVQARGQSLLILSELFYPGWRAQVDGKPAPILKVDGALRGIVVPSGASRIDLEYAPASFYVGLAISIATCLAACTLILSGRARLAAQARVQREAHSVNH